MRDQRHLHRHEAQQGRGPADDEHDQRLAELLPACDLALGESVALESDVDSVFASLQWETAGGAAPRILGMIGAGAGLAIDAYDDEPRGTTLSVVIPDELVVGCVARCDGRRLFAATPVSRQAFTAGAEPGLTRLVCGYFVEARTSGSRLLVRVRVQSDDAPMHLALRGLRGLGLGPIRAALRASLTELARRALVMARAREAHASYLRLRSLFDASRDRERPRSSGAP